MNTIIWAENQSFASTQDGDMVHKIIAGNLVVKCTSASTNVWGNTPLSVLPPLP